MATFTKIQMTVALVRLETCRSDVLIDQQQFDLYAKLMTAWQKRTTRSTVEVDLTADEHDLLKRLAPDAVAFCEEVQE